jgi:non-ribosomal peptide synthetase component E (peptide arylation enzyme)
MNLAALLFDVARRLPERPAVSDEAHSWNYGELAQRIARLAGGLRDRGATTASSGRYPRTTPARC